MLGRLKFLPSQNLHYFANRAQLHRSPSGKCLWHLLKAFLMRKSALFSFLSTSSFRSLIYEMATSVRPRATNIVFIIHLSWLQSKRSSRHIAKRTNSKKLVFKILVPRAFICLGSNFTLFAQSKLSITKRADLSPAPNIFRICSSPIPAAKRSSAPDSFSPQSSKLHNWFPAQTAACRSCLGWARICRLSPVPDICGSGRE